MRAAHSLPADLANASLTILSRYSDKTRICSLLPKVMLTLHRSPSRQVLASLRTPSTYANEDVPSQPRLLPPLGSNASHIYDLKKEGETGEKRSWAREKVRVESALARPWPESAPHLSFFRIGRTQKLKSLKKSRSCIPEEV